jgi:hypothetical protein
VRRLFAFVLVQAMVMSSATGSSLHVHEYAGHDHPEHHHGPAAHEHHHSAPAGEHHTEDQDHPGLQADSCDPGRHAVAATMVCAQAPRIHVDIAELPGPAILVAAVSVRSAIALTDVRVHGPPIDRGIPARAPPLTHLA